MLGGIQIDGDVALVNAIVDSDQFNVNACRLAWEYLLGRTEAQCEGPIFDACVDTFKKSGMIQDAVTTVAKDPSFCQ